MDPNILYIIIGAIALILGLIVGKIIFSKNSKKKLAEAEAQSQTIIHEAQLRAETIRKEKELEAKERFVKLKSAHDK
ncbi:MAG TPA: Rnase Y domain-containing protein, partial [Chitinophagaceae bacterium]|nr:Rnase Y domain-containing protein [Chitinophagaceae bacterium]